MNCQQTLVKAHKFAEEIVTKVTKDPNVNEVMKEKMQKGPLVPTKANVNHSPNLTFLNLDEETDTNSPAGKKPIAKKNLTKPIKKPANKAVKDNLTPMPKISPKATDPKVLALQEAVAIAKKSYKYWYNNKANSDNPYQGKEYDRSEPGLSFFSIFTLRKFTWFRHGSTGQKNAKTFKKAIENLNNELEILKKIAELLASPKTRYHEHSFVSFLLDQLRELTTSPINTEIIKNSTIINNRYNQGEYLNNLLIMLRAIAHQHSNYIEIQGAFRKLI